MRLRPTLHNVGRSWAGGGAALAILAAGTLLLSTNSAQAQDEDFELWLNPSIAVELDGDTGIELETAQRLRSADAGRADTYYTRLWLSQNLSDAVTLSGGVERRINDPGADETRLHQQVSASRGILRTRLRLEQRFVERGRMGLRVRPRLGVQVPIAASGKLAVVANAEAFLTLRSTSAGGGEGLTGIRTIVGLEYELSDRVSVSMSYLRSQSIVRGGADEVGHAPLLGIDLSF